MLWVKAPPGTISGVWERVRDWFGRGTESNPGWYTRLCRMEQDLRVMQDQIDQERLERKHLVADVEEHLDRATRRYGKARAAESRAQTAEDKDGAASPLSDTEQQLAILRARPSAFGG